MEAQVLALRDAHPRWGGTKLHHRLVAQGVADVPAPSTITAILGRHGRLDPAETPKHTPLTRFEHPEPNDLWQLDFMGHLPIQQGRVHPLSLLDDHSRVGLALVACACEQQDLVRKVNAQGIISIDNQRHFIGRGLAGMPVAVRPMTTDGTVTVHFCQQHGATLTRRDGSEVSPMSPNTCYLSPVYTARRDLVSR